MLRRIGAGCAILLAVMLGGCEFAIPEVTPTIAPTRTASATPILPSASPTVPSTATDTVTPSPTPTQTATVTLSPTPTLTPTVTASMTLTPSLTLTPVPSASATPIPSATPSATATVTPPPTETPTFTVTPPPTETPTFTVTPSLTASPQPTNTPPPTETPLPTLPPSPTPLPILPSRTPTPPMTATWTIPPSLTPPPSPSPLPLPSATGQQPAFVTVAPAFVTVPPQIQPSAAPPDDAPITATPALSEDARITPIGARSEADLTRYAPTALPPRTLQPIAGPPLTPIANPAVRAFTLDGRGGLISGGAFDLPFGAGVVRFAQNPVDPSQVAQVDPRGVLYLVRDGQASRPAFSPFSIFEPDAPERNNARVEQVAYSPDGRLLAFRVDTEADTSTENDSINDGIWIIEGDSARQIFGECPPVVVVCTVDRGGGPFVYSARDMAWSPTGDALLVTLWLGEEMRGAFAVITPGSPPNRIPDVYRYDTAHWTPDGRIAVAGRGLSGVVEFGIVGRDGAVDRLTRAEAIGLAWVQDAVVTRDGRLVLLGSPVGLGAPLALYDGAGRAITGPIGDAAPERVSWSPDRGAVLVVTQGGGVRRYYVAEIDGTVREITAAIAGGLAVEWVG